MDEIKNDINNMDTSDNADQQTAVSADDMQQPEAFAGADQQAEASVDGVQQATTSADTEQYANSEYGAQPDTQQTSQEPVRPELQNEDKQDRNSSYQYYTENIKKTKQKKTSVWQLILVSVLSSILGAGMMFAAVIYIGPLLNEDTAEMLGLPVRTAGTAGFDNGIYKKIEITESTSPVEAIAEKVSPSIVGIQITVPTRGSYGFFFDIEQNGVGYGSGIIIREDGYILTNNHVIEGALASQLSNKLIDGAKIEVVLPSNKDKFYTAQIVGRDEKTDIAVLKIDARNLPAAELGNSDEVKTGELAVAIGNPGGMDYMGSVTAGIISGINRTLTMENGREFKLLQTDAAINPGNSGGALVNSRGQVIGINTIKISATDVEGIGFAIPINEANEIAESLINFNYVKDRPYLGVIIDNTFTEEDAKAHKVPNGLLVYEVLPLSAAYKAGIHTGDIITRFDGVDVTTFKQLEDQKNKHKPGDEVVVEVYRDGETLTLNVILGEEKNID
jgi:serine protease Do